MEMRLSNNDSSLSSVFDDSDGKQIDISDNTYDPSINVEEMDHAKKLKTELFSILDINLMIVRSIFIIGTFQINL